MLKKGDKLICYNYIYGEIYHNLNDNMPKEKFVYGQEYEVEGVYPTGYEINGEFFYNDEDKTNMFYWRKFFRSQKDILNKKLKKVQNVKSR